MSDSIILLFGGSCSERKVSVASAQYLITHLPKARPWFWAENGAVYEVPASTLLSHQRPFEADFVPGVAARFPSLAEALDSCTPVDTFFLSLHGGAGEDGTVQALLEERRLYFTGSSAEASKQAFDKVRAKELVKARGGRVAESEVLRGSDLEAAKQSLDRMVAKQGRVVVKPVADGSSTGLLFIDGAAGIGRALEALKAQPRMSFLCEAFLSGKELTVGVLDTEDGPRALPASEVRLDGGRSFDYAGKYLGVGTKEITPAEVSEDVHREAGKLAVLAHTATGCSGYSRTDIIADTKGLTFLEINNLPGLTRASFIPQQIAAASITMGDFIARQLDLARSRYMRRG